MLTLIAVRFFGVVFFFGLTLMITNTFPVETVGQYEYVRPILLLLSGLILVGFDRSVLYYAGKLTTAAMTAVYRKMFLTVFAVSILFVLMILVLPEESVLWLGQGSNGALLLVKTVFALGAYALLTLNISFFRVVDNNRRAEFFIGFIKHVPFAIGVALLLVINKLEYLADAFLLSFIPLAIITTYMVVRSLPTADTNGAPAIWAMIQRSFPMAITAVGFWLLFSIDILIIDYYYDKTTVAIYAMPLKFVFLLNFVPTTISAAVSKDFSLLHNTGDSSKLKRKVRDYTRIVMGLTILPMFVLSIFSTEFLEIFGEDYTQGATVLQLMMLGTLVNLSCGLNVAYYNMTGKQVALQYFLITSVLVNLFLNLWLIPLYSILGAAIAFVAANVVLNLSTVIHTFKRDRIWLIIH